MRKFLVRELRPTYFSVTPGVNRPLPELGERIQVECDGKMQTVVVTKIDIDRNCFDAVEQANNVSRENRSV